MKEKE
jgi:hypothetical protein